MRRLLEVVAATGRFVDGLADDLARLDEVTPPDPAGIGASLAFGPDRSGLVDGVGPDLMPPIANRLREAIGAPPGDPSSADTPSGRHIAINVPGPGGAEVVVTPPAAGWPGRLTTPPAVDDPTERLPTPSATEVAARQITPAPAAGDVRLVDAADPGDPPALPAEPVWTPQRTDHVLVGDAAGGWHHRPGGVDPPNRRVVEVTERVGSGRMAGVYDAVVRICVGGCCRTKTTTFFPDHWTRSRVIETINQAHRTAHRQGLLQVDRMVAARSDVGFPVEFMADEDGAVVTAYPQRGERP